MTEVKTHLRARASRVLFLLLYTKYENDRPFHPCDGRCAPSSVLVKTQEKQRQNFCYHLGDGHKELTAPIGLVKDFNSGRSACGADWEILPASESVVRPGEIARER